MADRVQEVRHDSQDVSCAVISPFQFQCQRAVSHVVSGSAFTEVVLQDLIDTYMTIFLVGSQNFTAATVSKEAQRALRLRALAVVSVVSSRHEHDK